MKLKLANFACRLVAVLLFLVLAGCSNTSTQNIHLQYGNPSNAGDRHNNYLITRPSYALSYNCKQGRANWTSWQLDRSWLGKVDRSDNFRPDQNLPEDCYAAKANDYRRSGYDRGHLIPSGDRTRSMVDNGDTFIMSNIIPQSRSNNREVWRELEEYSRDLAFKDQQLYIVAGGSGRAETIAKSNITVPKFTWKAILILQQPDREPTADNTSTLAVWMPNTEEVSNTDWQDYIISIDQLEKKTGYNFFDRLDKQLQKAIEKPSYE